MQDNPQSVSDADSSSLSTSSSKDKTHTKPNSFHQFDHHSSSSNVEKKLHSITCDEFIRTAHLFFFNIDGDFLWTFVSKQFDKYFEKYNNNNNIGKSSPTLANQNQTTFDLMWPNQLAPINLALDQWCQVIRFLLNHLPLDTYPNVDGGYLPKLIVHLTNNLNTMLNSIDDDSSASSNLYKPIELYTCLIEIVGVLDILINRVKQVCFDFVLLFINYLFVFIMKNFF